VRCPNEPPCGHVLHDIYEPGDPYPTCCIEGCRCGHPGEAVIRKNHETGEVTVVSADPVLRVSRELLEQAEPWAWNGETLTLDTARTFRYRELRPDPRDPRILIFGRI